MSAIGAHPPTPLHVEDITPTWVSQILKTKISKKEEDFIIFTNVHAGSGFLSNMIRLTCKSDSKSYGLIIKLLPQDPIMNNLVISQKFDLTEINFYEIVVPDLLEIVPELKGYLCNSYYGHVQNEDPSKGLPYASVLVLEDLKPQGYYTINFAGEESPEQMIEVTEFLAKFHFAGYALEERKKIPLIKYYDFLQGIDLDENSQFYTMAKEGFPVIDKTFADNNVSQKIRNSIQSLVPYSNKMIQMVESASKQFPTLIHGDLWPPNMLFNDNPKFHTKVIDWQLCGYRDPTYDLAVTIVSSLPERKLNRENVEEQLQLYYDTYKKHCVDAGLPRLIKRDFKSFSQFFYTFAMAYTMLWFLMSSDPFAGNIPKLIRIYEFLAIDLKVPEFIISEANKQ